MCSILARQPAWWKHAMGRPSERDTEGMSVAIPVNPAVMRWARESVEAAIQEAAAPAEVDPSVMAAWESGTDRPTIGPLRELAAFYRRPRCGVPAAGLPRTDGRLGAPEPVSVS